MSGAAALPASAQDASVVPQTVAMALMAARGRVPLREVRVLLCHVLGWSHARLACYPEHVLSVHDRHRFLRALERRERGEPVAYLTARCEFYGRTFHVDPRVLIPRHETELIVDLALENIGARPAPKVLDLGTGSGVIAITIALELRGAIVTAVDQSAEALAVARHNAEALKAQVGFRRSDWFAEVGTERFDLILANPPYVAAGDAHLSRGDLRFEPVRALADGSADGIGSIAAICRSACGHLEPGGWLWSEHGWDQAAQVRALMRQGGMSVVHSRRDLAGILRATGGRRIARL